MFFDRFSGYLNTATFSASDSIKSKAELKDRMSELVLTITKIQQIAGTLLQKNDFTNTEVHQENDIGEIINFLVARQNVATAIEPSQVGFNLIVAMYLLKRDYPQQLNVTVGEVTIEDISKVASKIIETTPCKEEEKANQFARAFIEEVIKLKNAPITNSAPSAISQPQPAATTTTTATTASTEPAISQPQPATTTTTTVTTAPTGFMSFLASIFVNPFEQAILPVSNAPRLESMTKSRPKQKGRKNLTRDSFRKLKSRTDKKQRNALSLDTKPRKVSPGDIVALTDDRTMATASDASTILPTTTKTTGNGKSAVATTPQASIQSPPQPKATSGRALPQPTAKTSFATSAIVTKPDTTPDAPVAVTSTTAKTENGNSAVATTPQATIQSPPQPKATSGRALPTRPNTSPVISANNIFTRQNAQQKSGVQSETVTTNTSSTKDHSATVAPGTH